MNFDNQMYACVCRHRLGAFLRERDVSAMDRATTIADIISGEIENISEVIEINPKEGWSRVATEDMAIAVAQKVADAGCPIRRELYDWIADRAPQAAYGLRVYDPTLSAA